MYSIGINKTNWLAVIFLWLIGCGAAMQFSKFSISFDSVASHYKLTTFASASVLSCIGFMGIFFGVLAGYFVGAVGARPLLIFALAAGAIVSGLQSLLPSFGLFFLSRLLEGISHLLIVVAAPIEIIRFSSSNHRSVAMGLWSTFFGVAYAITGFTGSSILRDFGLSGLLQTHALFLVILLLAYSVLSNGHSNLKHVLSSDQVRELIIGQFAVYRSAPTALPGIVFFCHTLMFIALLTYIPQLSTEGPEQDTLVRYLPLFSVIGSLIGGLINQRYRPAIRQVFVSFPALSVILSVVWLITGTSLLVPISLLAMLTAGVAQASIFAAIPQLSPEMSGQAQANGAITQLGNLGSTLGPPIFALGFSALGKQVVPLLASIIALFGSIIVFIFMMRCSHQSKSH